MRRKNRKWVAIAVGLYLLVMVSAYRWSVGNRLPGEDNLFIKIQREGVRRLAEEKAKEAAAVPNPTGESRLTAAGPAYAAARYDATHVVFMLAAETESRFSNSQLIRSAGTPTKVPAPSRPAAPLAGMQELWEPDPQALHFFPEIVQKTQPGDRWTLSLAPGSSIPVAIDRIVVAPMGCSLALGFLATVPPDQQPAFAASDHEYFAIRRTAVELADPPVTANIGELARWRASPTIAKQIEQQLNDRMKQEVAKIDARLIANAGSPGATAGQTLFDAHPHLKEWIHADQGLQRGEGTLDYDVRAFHLTPDAAPRLFVRARWKLADDTVFLMTTWFKLEAGKVEEGSAAPVLLAADSSWSAALRNGEPVDLSADRLDFQTILNQFDDDHDGWAELLVHSRQAASSDITLYLYTDLGLVPMKSQLRRDGRASEACINP